MFIWPQPLHNANNDIVLMVYSVLCATGYLRISVSKNRELLVNILDAFIEYRISIKTFIKLWKTFPKPTQPYPKTFLTYPKPIKIYSKPI